MDSMATTLIETLREDTRQGIAQIVDEAIRMGAPTVGFSRDQIIDLATVIADKSFSTMLEQTRLARFYAPTKPEHLEMIGLIAAVKYMYSALGAFIDAFGEIAARAEGEL
jgi:hypothetical protein